MIAQLQKDLDEGGLGMGMGITYTPTASADEILDLFYLAGNLSGRCSCTCGRRET